MKKLFLLLFLPLCLTLVASGCHDDDDSIESIIEKLKGGDVFETDNFLVGKWHHSYFDGGVDCDVEEYFTFFNGSSGIWEKYFYDDDYGNLVDIESDAITYTYNPTTNSLKITTQSKVWNFAVKIVENDKIHITFSSGYDYGIFRRE